MDAFYASVEQRDRPELRNKPIAVGGSRERGVVAAASYEARRYGIHSAMPSALAFRRCPDLIFVKPNFEKYRQVSHQIREIFLDYTDLVEPLSLDEAYLDVTHTKSKLPTATRIAKEIRTRIWEETELTASAGISINKFMAKIASDLNKPNGQKTILPEEVLAFLEQLPIGKFYGIGAKTAQKMKSLGIHRGSDLKKWGLGLLIKEFGKSGQHYYQIVRGIHNSAVKPDRERKSIGAERTFEHDLNRLSECQEQLDDIFQIWLKRISNTEQKGKTVTLKIKYHDFSQHTRSKTLARATNEPELLWQTALELLHEQGMQKPIRLLGLSLSNLNDDSEPQYVQLSIDF